MPDSAWWDKVRADRDARFDPVRLHARVRIRSKRRKPAIGVIEALHTTDNLPDIPGHPETPGSVAGEILREFGATRLAMILIEETYMFAALEVSGRWFDLQRQELTIDAA